MSLMFVGIISGIGDIFEVGGKVVELLGKTGTMLAGVGTHAIMQGALWYWLKKDGVF